jgi:pimeloyl-ACP methyl ester carboxylesterase
MADSNVLEFVTASAGYEPLARRLLPIADGIRTDPASLILKLGEELQAPDRKVVADAGIRELLVKTYAEALRASAYGWIDDLLAFSSPWGFDLSEVATSVYVWHGAQDTFTPPSHGIWLASHIPTATILVQPDASHFTALDVLPDILRWLAHGGSIH